MLKLLRRKNVTKKIFYVLAAIIIPAFVIWGSASVMQKDKTPPYAGVIFGEKVSFDDFRRTMAAWKIQLMLQYGEKTNEIINAFFNPVEATWDRLILLHEVKKRKIKIDNKEIVDAITKFPFLQKDGIFDPQAYALFLKYSLNISARIFEEELRQNIAMGKIFTQTTKDITVSEDEIQQAYLDQNEQTRVKYVFFPANGYKEKVTIQDDELKTFYENSKEEFRIPPKINVEYLMVKFDEQTSAAFKETAREKMKQAQTLAKKQSFEEIAKKLILENQETGFFSLNDPIPTLGWMPQLGPVLFDLSVQETSQVIELDRGGIFLFKLLEKKEAYLPEFKEAKEKAVELLKNKKSKEIAHSKAIEFIKKATASDANFDKTAEDLDIKTKETPLFSRSSYVSELGMAGPLKETAFKLHKDEVAGNPIELEQGYYCIQSIETINIDEEKYRKEKEAFAQQLLDQKKNKAFSDFFEELKKQAHLINYIDGTTQKNGKRL
ncbi:MAG: SurA N-terminal domain-containing protein [Candidatus Omnitrophota bacterium]